MLNSNKSGDGLKFVRMGPSDKRGSFNFIPLSDSATPISTSTKALLVDSERIIEIQLNRYDTSLKSWAIKIDEAFHPTVNKTYFRHHHGWCMITNVDKFNFENCSDYKEIQFKWNQYINIPAVTNIDGIVY